MDKTLVGRWPLMVNILWWKTTSERCWTMTKFVEKGPLIEHNLRWNMTFGESLPLMEDANWMRTTYDGRQPIMEDNIWWNTTIDRKWPLFEDDFSCKTPFDGTQSLIEDGLWRTKTFMAYLFYVSMEGNLEWKLTSN